MTQKKLLQVKNVKKYFDVTKGFIKKNKVFLRAVDGVSFDLSYGETLGIVGESGCGKSTLGNVIIRLLQPTEGQIIFEGVDLANISSREMREKRKNIQMIFQDPYSSLNPRMRVFDIIAEPLRTHGICSGKEMEKRVFELMDVVGLNRVYHERFPHEFSGGQRQRIGIARALALNPNLIICDEPVSALDVSIQAQVLNLLSSLQKEFDLTYIFIAHGLPAVKHVSDRIAVMYLGKIVELASKEELFRHPMHPYTEGLLSAVPIPDPRQRGKREKIILEGDMPSPTEVFAGCRFAARCRYADEVCRSEAPELKAQRPEHFLSCHHPLENGAGIWL